MYREFAGLGQRLMDRRQRRPEVRRLGHVVDSGHPQSLGNGNTEAVGSQQHSEGHLVVAGKYRIDVRAGI